MTKKLTDVFAVGEVLYGFCNGYFGRDSYDDKRVEAVGADWMIVREGEFPRALTIVPDGIEEMAKEWKNNGRER